MKRYNIPRYKSFTNEAKQSPSILENLSITAILKIVTIKATELSGQFGRKLRPLRKKVRPHSNFSFFGVICTIEENNLSLCV
jgi:hypothetical protein